MYSAQGNRKARPKAKAKVGSKVSTATATTASGGTPGGKKRTSKRKIVVEVRERPPSYSRLPRRHTPPQPVAAFPSPPPPYATNPVFPAFFNVTHPEFQVFPPSTPFLPPSPPPSPPLWSTSAKAASSVDVSKVRKKSRQKSMDKYDLPIRERQGCTAAESDTRSLVSNKFDAVISRIDAEGFSGAETEQAILASLESDPSLRGGWGFMDRGANRTASNPLTGSAKKQISLDFLVKKVERYANSRLPPNIPALHVFLPAWPIICQAAQNSLNVYNKPSGHERGTQVAHIDADRRLGTKAMILKSIPLDAKSVIVFAIRGTSSFMDWAVNMQTTPTAPTDFLDDEGNWCHAGFLAVARRMLHPVAVRLRALLEENPARAACSLVFTGHSAGGAVASLLFAHMLATRVRSELNVLADCFRHVHCVTFGAPPVSLLPLRKPEGRKRQHSLFFSFVNEGDPIPRVSRAYFLSLLDLFVAPTPGAALPASADPSSATALPAPPPPPPPSKFRLFRFGGRKHSRADSGGPAVVADWPLPPGTLANAGKLVVLRRAWPYDDEGAVRAVTTTDAQLRTVVYGDPMMHLMERYAKRVEGLATRAVTGKGAS